MTSFERQEIMDEIEVATLMVKDLKRLWSSYAKKALIAKEERELKQDKKGFLEYSNINELADSYGWGDIDEDTYKKGMEYFENINKPPKLSVIETHRKNIKDLINRWEGIINELNAELSEDEPKFEENIFDKMARQEREERYRGMFLNENLREV